MLERVDLDMFKCFTKLRLPLRALTLLTGTNASGKSSILQAIAAVHQTARYEEWSKRLLLNGAAVELGTVTDVVDSTHGRGVLGIGIVDSTSDYAWSFSGDRADMSMAVTAVRVNSIDRRHPRSLHYLLPKPLAVAHTDFTTRLRRLTYITAERMGPRDIYPLADIELAGVVGSQGQHAVGLMFWAGDKHVLDSLVLPGSAPTLLRQVDERMRMFFPGCAMETQRVSGANAIRLGLRTSTATGFLRPVNAGFGLTQVLPIVVAVLSAHAQDILLIENPEVHLHPSGQAKMGQFLACAAASGVQIIVETHSDHVLNGVRRAVRFGQLSPGSAAIHFFSRDADSSFVVSPQIIGSGELDNWPSGFFDQFDIDSTVLAGWAD